MNELLRRLRPFVLMTIAVFAAGVASMSFAAAPKDKREMAAREAYAASRYQDALDMFVKLYAETLHPNYLRNIGRCYQNLGDADKAIGAFREYLRKAKGLSADERAEIDGYVKEMEEVKAKKAAPPPTIPEPQKDTGHVEPASGPPPVMMPPPGESTALVGQSAAPPPVEESTPIYKKGWFWGVVGGVVAASLVGVLLVGGSNNDPPCNDGRECGGP